MKYNWYTTTCLPEVIDELRKNNRKRRITLHHDNASSPTAKHTNKFLKEKKCRTYEQYSLDLAPCNFFSLQKLRTNYAVNDFHHQKRLSKSMKNMFPRSPGRSAGSKNIHRASLSKGRSIPQRQAAFAERTKDGHRRRHDRRQTSLGVGVCLWLVSLYRADLLRWAQIVANTPSAYF
ncbi:hypothetical protein EVAR_17440_1 [Eumeta japonica]|uniref:Mariner Mos1 transposase n=1 Tax=Eumeta variegata TaxID=151549 RepID=A0A4C1V9M4_EUMVA|nr:hypothetical protein EVAR_17440_1 [Eumeta japonica]